MEHEYVRSPSHRAGPSSSTHDVTRRRNGVRSSIGMVSQFVALDWLHSGRENLVLLGRLQKLSKANATRRTQQLLERFELTEAGDRPTS